jgi:hypothetical protein
MSETEGDAVVCACELVQVMCECNVGYGYDERHPIPRPALVVHRLAPPAPPAANPTTDAPATDHSMRSDWKSRETYRTAKAIFGSNVTMRKREIDGEIADGEGVAARKKMLEPNK